ncbi:hypothetical protein Tco_0681057 [Tanacetum coccineum]|uniref:Uncharacterized protein n=1 Tax=Tanacetum coccineum TaxID=301880 RepID=A0ABQ4XM97_9ASTR
MAVSVNYSLLVDPDLIGPWLQQFWATASLQVINDVPHIRAKVAGKKILISEATIRADLLFDDENGVDCFPKQSIGLRSGDIGTGKPVVTKFSCRITPLDSIYVRGGHSIAEEKRHSTSPHLGLQVLQGNAQAVQLKVLLISTYCFSTRYCFLHDASQTLEEMRGLLDIYALNREVRRLKKQTLSQAKQIIKLKAKLKKLSKFVQPVVKHHAFWVESQNLKKQKRRRKKQKKCSFCQNGEIRKNGTLSEEHYVHEEDTAHHFLMIFVEKGCSAVNLIGKKSDEMEGKDPRREWENHSMDGDECLRSAILLGNEDWALLFRHAGEMDDPNITMEEYIQLMADKARGDFETDFPAIVYNDASTSNQNVSSEPTVSIYNAIKSDIDFHISFFDSEDEDYTFIYNKDSSSYKLIPANDLKPEPVNDYVEINIKSCSENIDVKPMDSVICISKDTTPVEFDKNFDTNHDIHRKFSKIKGYFSMIKVVIHKRFHNGMP